ncbi:MAG: hypothetical protein H7Y38_08255 [Armatimonadetes bacterium]|nr:hypothetical protein [Armatimonadota bacterium]
MNLKRIALAALIGAMVSGIAYAQTTTTHYTPNPSDMGDFDHHKLCTWKLTDIDLSTREIVSASLSFDNIRNWNAEPNVLHMYLFDNAKYNGVKGFFDDNPNNENVTDLTDDFINPRYHNGKDATGANAPWLINPGTASTFLVDKSFGTSATDYKYDFIANGKANVLTQYLLNGNNLAFGFDPDCHYFNDGVKFSITTRPASSPGGQYGNQIPEAGTVSLLAIGAGLIGSILVRRRK